MAKLIATILVAVAFALACSDGEPGFIIEPEPTFAVEQPAGNDPSVCYLGASGSGVKATVGSTSQEFPDADQARTWCWYQGAQAEEATDETECLGANPCPIPPYEPPPASVRCRQNGMVCACGDPELIDKVQGAAAQIVDACTPPDSISEGKEWTCDTWSGLCRCQVENAGMQGYWNSVGAGVESCP